MVTCLERSADLHIAQLMPLPLTISCFSKIQFNFTFLVPTHRGSPRQRAIKQVLRIHEKLVGKREASKFPTRLPTHFTCGNFMMKSLKGGIELMTHCRRAANVNSNISPRRSDPRSSNRSLFISALSSAENGANTRKQKFYDLTQ